jgi:hypothetical protein
MPRTKDSVAARGITAGTARERALKRDNDRLRKTALRLSTVIDALIVDVVAVVAPSIDPRNSEMAEKWDKLGSAARERLRAAQRKNGGQIFTGDRPGKGRRGRAAA